MKIDTKKMFKTMKLSIGIEKFATVTKAFVVAVALTVSPLVATAQDDHPAQALVLNSTNNLLDVLKTEGDRIKEDKDFLKSKVVEHVVPSVDFKAMTQLAVGKAWRQADDAQRESLIEEFRALLLNTYTAALSEYGGESMNFEPFKPQRRDDRAVVRSSFKSASGSLVDVMYKLRDREGWRIYDIEVNQISLVLSYKNAFANEIEKGGIDGLIQTMKDRNAKA